MTERVEAVRAGFWRRAFAFLVDCFIINLLLQAVAVFAFPLTDGRVQLLTSVIGTVQDCKTLIAIPPGIIVSAFEPNYIVNCRHVVAGRPFGQALEIGRRTSTGSGTTDGSITIAVDQSGRPSGIFALDWFILPLTLLLRWRWDRHGATPGRWLTRIHVEARDTKERPAPGLAKRYGLFALLFIPLLPIEIWPMEVLNFFGAMPFIYSMVALAFVEAMIVLAFVIVPVVKRRDAFYDHFAGTAVVLDKQPKSEGKSEGKPEG